MRLNDGITLQQFGAAMQSGGPEAALGLVTGYGGPGTVAPGGTQAVAVNLVAGNYIMLCFVSDEDGVPHVAKGMIAPFEVAPPPSTAVPPAASATVTMRDFTFDIPALTAGRQTLQVTNQGPQLHEMGLVKAGPGATLEPAGSRQRHPDRQAGRPSISPRASTPWSASCPIRTRANRTRH